MHPDPLGEINAHNPLLKWSMFSFWKLWYLSDAMHHNMIYIYLFGPYLSACVRALEKFYFLLENVICSLSTWILGISLQIRSSTGNGELPLLLFNKVASTYPKKEERAIKNVHIEQWEINWVSATNVQKNWSFVVELFCNGMNNFGRLQKSTQDLTQLTDLTTKSFGSSYF